MTISAPGIEDGSGEGGLGGCSWYICLQMLLREERESCFVSKASRTRITSRGYVKNTLVTPAREPESRRRSGVSLEAEGMMTERICS